MIRRVPSKQRNATVVREADRSALMRLGMLLFCGLVLAGGFVYAGSQHFAALKLGYETENMRKVRDQLVEDQHRLVLAREEAASPARLERAARQLGMQPMQAAQVDPLRRPLKSLVEKNSAAPAQSASAPARIIRTRPVGQRNPNESSSRHANLITRQR
ncbi:MAG TPA: hypothetical protein VHD88_01310 [Pyrinomonadaceae bacterium]|nr:hypothetical protein [Pyrinomonadaceae bacterium]